MSTSNSDEEACEEEFENFERSLSEMYRSMKVNTDCKNEGYQDVAEGGFEQTTEKTEQGYVLPSKENFEKYIYYPSPWEEDFEEQNQGGKWMMFVHGDLDKLDHNWTVLQRLCHDGTIIKIKSSTATDTVEGITMCYTADYKNKDIVKKAADEIMKLIDYDQIMYYKTNQTSIEGKYHKYGDNEVSEYMYTVKGGFYEKDRHNRWTCLNMEKWQNI